MMARLYVCNAGGLVAVDRDHMVGDHVLRRLEPDQEAARGLDEFVGLTSAWLTTEDRSEVGLYLIGETGSIERPVPRVGSGGIAELNVAYCKTIKEIAYVCIVDVSHAATIASANKEWPGSNPG